MIRLIKSILKSCLVPPKFIILVLIDAILFFNFKKKSSKDRVDFKSVNLLTFSRNNGLAYVMEDIGGILSNKFILNYVYLISPAPFVKRILSRLRSMTLKKNSINIFVGNPNMIPITIFLNRYIIFENCFNVGFWFWELEDVPLRWKFSKKFINEVWVYSEFNANIFKSLNSNVYKIPFAVDIKIDPTYDRPYFGLPTDSFIFLFTFDFGSSMDRKNPLAVVRAFTNVFKNSENTLLVIKSVKGDSFPSYKNDLIELMKNVNNIILVDKLMSQDEKNALINCCDCYVSLHRSEGLGLGMAEAMYLGKPVIATNFSGNLEFMNSSNSCLVDYKLIKVKVKEYPHSSFLKKRFWADPDINHASELMLKIKMNKSFRDKIGKQASRDIKLNFSKEKQSASILARLRAISNYQ